MNMTRTKTIVGRSGLDIINSIARFAVKDIVKLRRINPNYHIDNKVIVGDRSESVDEVVLLVQPGQVFSIEKMINPEHQQVDNNFVVVRLLIKNSEPNSVKRMDIFINPTVVDVLLGPDASTITNHVS